MARSAENSDEYRQRELLWMYLPNWDHQGAIETIPHVKQPLGGDDDVHLKPGDSTYYWEETKDCAGFTVGDDCQWRYEEMSLISYTP